MPHLSVSLGVPLAMVRIGVLIYFIHHVSVSIQADEVVARVGRELEGHQQDSCQDLPHLLKRLAICQKCPPIELFLHRNPLQHLNFKRFGRFAADLKPGTYRPSSRAHYRNLSMGPVFTRISHGGHVGPQPNIGTVGLRV